MTESKQADDEFLAACSALLLAMAMDYPLSATEVETLRKSFEGLPVERDCLATRLAQGLAEYRLTEATHNFDLPFP